MGHWGQGPECAEAAAERGQALRTQLGTTVDEGGFLPQNRQLNVKIP